MGDVEKYTYLSGVSVFVSVIDIEDEFVWDMLEHARKYLRATAMA